MDNMNVLNRFSKLIKFIRVNTEYNTETSKDDYNIIIDSEQYATGYAMTSTEELKNFGVVTNNHYIFTILGYYTKEFDYIYFNKKYYKLVNTSQLKLKQTFIVEQITNNLGDLDGQ